MIASHFFHLLVYKFQFCLCGQKLCNSILFQYISYFHTFKNITIKNSVKNVGLNLYSNSSELLQIPNSNQKRGSIMLPLCHCQNTKLLHQFINPNKNDQNVYVLVDLLLKESLQFFLFFFTHVMVTHQQHSTSVIAICPSSAAEDKICALCKGGQLSSQQYMSPYNGSCKLP